MSAIKLLKEARGYVAARHHHYIFIKGQMQPEEVYCERCELLASIDALLKTGGWIPVTERLPTVTGVVWAVIAPDDGPDYPPYSAMAFFSAKKRDWSHFSNIDDEPYPLYKGEVVTHWMPLPLPPDEKAYPELFKHED